jgi:hypothetical protein
VETPDPPQPSQPVDIERTEEEQRAFFDAVMERTQQAVSAAGAIERLIEVAGVRLRLVFAGPELEREFMGSLAHLV